MVKRDFWFRRTILMRWLARWRRCLLIPNGPATWGRPATGAAANCLPGMPLALGCMHKSRCCRWIELCVWLAGAAPSPVPVHPLVSRTGRSLSPANAGFEILALGLQRPADPLRPPYDAASFEAGWQAGFQRLGIIA